MPMILLVVVVSINQSNVTRSIYVTSGCSSFLMAGHETKEFDQISIIMGISSPGDQLHQLRL